MVERDLFKVRFSLDREHVTDISLGPSSFTAGSPAPRARWSQAAHGISYGDAEITLLRPDSLAS
jgi:hypothetical protein